MENYKDKAAKDLTLDPHNWDEMRALGHLMMDDMMDHFQKIHDSPSWRPIPDQTKEFLNEKVPQQGLQINEIYKQFKENILPYNKGNIHPRFFAWVQGTGTPFGVLAEFLAAAMNPNVTIGEHSSMYVDQQVVNWCKQILNYPDTSSGILLSGASMANITALTVARDHQLGINIRKYGVQKAAHLMTIYCSTETHSCVQKAAELLGLGTDSVRTISVHDNYEIDIIELEKTISEDIHKGFLPFAIVGNAGTVNTGAIDPLNEMAAIAKKYNLWFHIDGAFGALAKLIPHYADKLSAIENCDSVAFDLHKWLYMPYEIGCTLIKDAKAHRNSFAVNPEYLNSEERGLAGGPDPISNYGPELSRGFKALKVWMSLKEHGLEKYTAMIDQNIAQAHYMQSLIEETNELEMITPVTLNIVCYRYKKEGFTIEQLNQLNKLILINLQEKGIASPSSTVLHGTFAIRVCIVNQRSRMSDFDLLVKETIKLGNELIKEIKA